MPCPCCQPIHWPVHPCPTIISSMLPTHPLASASMLQPFINTCFRAEASLLFLVFGVFGCAYHNGNFMLSNANMRKYRPCHAVPTLFEAAVKAEPGLKPPSRPATAPPCQHQETRPRRNIEFLLRQLTAYHHSGDAIFDNANMRKYRSCHAFRTLFEDRLWQKTVPQPLIRSSVMVV